MAENKVLKRLANVPENFGFDLEQIKVKILSRLPKRRKLKTTRTKFATLKKKSRSSRETGCFSDTDSETSPVCIQKMPDVLS